MHLAGGTEASLWGMLSHCPLGFVLLPNPWIFTADPPNPGTFWAPDACTIIYKNGITAQQSSLDIEGNKDDGVGGLMTIL